LIVQYLPYGSYTSDSSARWVSSLFMRPGDIHTSTGIR
jgi:hypothetical protein